MVRMFLKLTKCRMYGSISKTAEMPFSVNRRYAGKSKIVRYEIPCGFMGIAQHTKPKAEPTDICTDRNIGTWKGQNME